MLVTITGGVSPTVVSDTVATVVLGLGQVTTVSVRVTVPPNTLADRVDSTTLIYTAAQCPGGPLASGTSPAAITSVEPDANFASYDGQVIIRTDGGKSFEIPLTATTGGNWCIIAHINNTSPNGAKLININKVQAKEPAIDQFS